MSQSVKTPRIQHFILLFDRHKGHMLDQLSFGTDSRAAMEQYEALEQRFRHESHVDIVLVGSDSIETVKVTHANYFDGTAKDVYADVLSIASA